MSGCVDEAGHLFILGGQVPDGIVYEVHKYKADPDPGSRHVPDRDLDPTCAILSPQAVDHGGGEVDPRYGQTAVRQWQRHAARADCELKRHPVPCEFGQDIHCLTEHLGSGHVPGALVVECGDVLSEMVCRHLQIIAPTCLHWPAISS